MRQSIIDFITANTTPENWEHNTVPYISRMYSLPRSEVSSIIAQLVKEQIAVKVNTRPAVFLSLAELKDHWNYTGQNYTDPQLYFGCKSETSDFESLIGSKGTLYSVVQTCKSTISYPPAGLPLLLTGPTGSGKSFLAQATADYARNHGLISGRFVSVNCSEYANNPELLSANLFGYVKGAFTGADADRPGLIELANNGVLFLDEVHNLSGENQEKLFQFMDRGIYHRMGDNKTWYESNVRFIFATTEDVSKVLLKTLQRRIPITVAVPALEEWELKERAELVYSIFKTEEERIGKTILVSTRIFNFLVSGKIPGNIGGLKSLIQAICVNAYQSSMNKDSLTISLHNLPASFLHSGEQWTGPATSTGEFLPIDTLIKFTEQEKPLLVFFDKTLNNDLEHFYDRFTKLLEENSQTGKKSNYYHQEIHNLVEFHFRRHHIEIYNNEILEMTNFINLCFSSMREIAGWMDGKEDRIESCTNLLRKTAPSCWTLSRELMTMIEGHLEIELPDIITASVALLLARKQYVSENASRAAVILAHGYSTASSMAEACNSFLKQYVFDAIDMPLTSSLDNVIGQLNDYIRSKGYVEDLVLLVDMGSLETILEGLSYNDMNLGLMNSVTTKSALEVGMGLIQGESLDTLFERVKDNSSIHYTIEHSRSKKKAILCSCPSGIGTAEKLAMIVRQSLPEGIDIEVKTLNYPELVQFGQDNSVFADYEVLFTVGTLDPDLDGFRFVPIEDLIIREDSGQLDFWLKDSFTEEQILNFKNELLKNFSLTNVMNVISILNPNILLKYISHAIDNLQQEVNVKFTNSTCFGLYVHTCCLIERLVLNKGIENYLALDDFQKDHKDFIAKVKKAFHEVESFYNVSIPTEEIGYIYDYVTHN